MTTEERVSTIAPFGFTRRQARFLAMVMRHSGVCLLRQYSAFAGIVHGQKTCAFFQKLVSRRYAFAYGCRHNRGRLYHVHHYPLYRAIGEPNSSYRRPVPAGRLVERLMLLDAVVADPALEWLATEAEKVAYFTTSPCPVPVEKLPRTTMRVGSPPVGNPFPDKLPIGIDSTGRAVCLYLVLPSGREDFRVFLGRHAELFRTLPLWTLRLGRSASGLARLCRAPGCRPRRAGKPATRTYRRGAEVVLRGAEGDAKCAHSPRRRTLLARVRGVRAASLLPAVPTVAEGRRRRARCGLLDGDQ
jgi:hypothetical protein